MLRPTTTSAHGCHAITSVTPECPIDLDGFDHQGIGGDLVKDVVGIKGTVIISDPGVIAADEKM